MGKCRRTRYDISRVNNDAFNVHVRIVLVKPGARTVHLFRLSLVNFCASNLDLTLALPKKILLGVQSPKVVRSLLPFLIGALSNKSQSKTKLIESRLEFVCFRSERQPGQNVGKRH